MTSRLFDFAAFFLSGFSTGLLAGLTWKVWESKHVDLAGPQVMEPDIQSAVGKQSGIGGRTTRKKPVIISEELLWERENEEKHVPRHD